MNDKLSLLFKRLSKNLDYSSYSAVSNFFDLEGPQEWSKLKVAVLRNFTLESIIPVIKGEIALMEFYPEVYLGDYDSIAKDVFDAKSPLYEFNPNIIVLAQWLETLSPKITRCFTSLTLEKLETVKDELVNQIYSFVISIRKNTSTPVLINNFPLPPYPAFGVLDAQSENYQSHVILQINQELIRFTKELKDIYIVDFMGLMSRIGSLQGIDERYWQMGQSPIGRKAIVQVGREYGKFFRAICGKVRKCLVLIFMIAESYLLCVVKITKKML